MMEHGCLVRVTSVPFVDNIRVFQLNDDEKFMAQGAELTDSILNVLLEALRHGDVPLALISAKVVEMGGRRL